MIEAAGCSRGCQPRIFRSHIPPKAVRAVPRFFAADFPDLTDEDPAADFPELPALLFQATLFVTRSRVTPIGAT